MYQVDAEEGGVEVRREVVVDTNACVSLFVFMYARVCSLCVYI